MKLADDRGFPDAGIARYQHELRRALVDDSIEGRDESLDLALAPIELLRDQQLLRPVLSAQREGIDAAPAFPCAQAPPQIGLEAGRRLVAVLARLGEQLHDDARDRRRDAADPLVRGHRLPGDVTMDPLHGVGGGEGSVPVTIS